MEATPKVEPELEKSTLSEKDSEVNSHDDSLVEERESKKSTIAKSTGTETDSESDSEENPWVEERDSSRLTCKTYAIACFVLLLPLLGGIVYSTRATPRPILLPSTVEALDDTANQVGNSTQDEILFHQFNDSQLGRDKRDGLDDSGISDLDLTQSRSSLSNSFDLEKNTFIKENQWIDQGNRMRVKAGNRWYYLQQGSDGNLILYDQDFNFFWQSGLVRTPDSRKYSTVMQQDGNLITVSRINFQGTPTLEWASYSPSKMGGLYNVALTPNHDGLMVVLRDEMRTIWSTSSSVPPSPPANPPPRPQPNPPAPRPQPNPPAPQPTPPSVPGVSYTPGKLTRRENGLLLSEGLRSRLVARTGRKVVLDGNGNQESNEKFHVEPDGAAVFENFDTGGWIYVSNSEAADYDFGRNKGGVGALYFDRFGRTTGYRMLIKGTTANCSGGKTPWNTWVTCEETANGRAYQVDPYGKRGMQAVTMDQGWFEAFAYDIRDSNRPRFFITEDDSKGALRRFSPTQVDWNDAWNILHSPGVIEYLVLEPTSGNGGTYRWTTDKKDAERSAQSVYPFSEGMDVYRNQLFFTAKARKELFTLNLDGNTYEKQSTRSGMFDGEPDQVKRIVDDGLLYCSQLS